MPRLSSHRRSPRDGFSLLEVMIASTMASFVVAFAAAVSMDIGKGFIAGIADARIVTEFRLLGETLRRDFSGSLPEIRTGGPKQWRLVGRQLVSDQELRLCFDSDDDGSVNWVGSDRIITYWIDGEQLIRSDSVSGADFIACHNISELEFSLGSGHLHIDIEITFGERVEHFHFDTADVN